MNKYAIAFAFLLAVAVALPHETNEKSAVTDKQAKDGEKTGDEKAKDDKEKKAKDDKKANSASTVHFTAISAIVVGLSAYSMA
ncbi:hypothetical protein IWQ61_001671 [Dispira simplex]|nr:hypothetical protein IWQ61_001671 [Dispira simplex]